MFKTIFRILGLWGMGGYLSLFCVSGKIITDGLLLIFFTLNIQNNSHNTQTNILANYFRITVRFSVWSILRIHHHRLCSVLSEANTVFLA